MEQYRNIGTVGYDEIGKTAAKYIDRNDEVDFLLHRPMKTTYDVTVLPINGENEPMTGTIRCLDVEETEDLESAIENELNDFGVPDHVRVIRGKGLYRVELK